MGDELERAVRRREQAPTGLGSLMGSVTGRLGTSASRSASVAAFVAWNRVNGDVERAHVTGVYVGEPRRGARDPELTVYVDSSAFLTDFSANREIYLARMETAGLRFSSISFRLSKHKKHKKGTGSFLHKKSNHHAAPPELTDAERQEVANACSQLPASLRERVFRAMSASYRAQKQQNSDT